MQTVDLVVRSFRPSVLSDSDAFAQTVLIDPRVSGEAAEVAGAAVVLAVDVSGSMTGSKLEQAKAAARVIVDHLRQGDRLAIVAFDHEASVASPLTDAAGSASARSAIDNLHPGGGTEMGKAMILARSLLSETRTESARRVVVLTDGETADEDVCRSEARAAANAKLPISAYGIGAEWNTELLSFIAETTRGRVRHIASANAVAADLAGEFKDLQDTALIEAKYVFVLSEGVQLKSVHRVIPDVVSYPVVAGQTDIEVGDISRNPAIAPKFLADLVLPPRPAGLARVARVQMTYREVGTSARRETAMQDVVVTYTPDRGAASMVDGEIKGLIDLRTAAELVQGAEQDLAAGNAVRATTRLQNARKVTERIGQPQVTQKLTEAIDAISQNGQLSADQAKTIRFAVKQTRNLGE